MALNDQVPNSLRPGFSRWAGVLVVTCWLNAAAHHAAASCGDYLHGHQRLNNIVQPVRGFHATRPLTRVFDRPSSPAPERDQPRCTGPSCQSAPWAPYDAPRPEWQEKDQKEICAGDGLAALQDDGWSSLDRVSKLFADWPISARLDRPPRAA